MFLLLISSENFAVPLNCNYRRCNAYKETHVEKDTNLSEAIDDKSRLQEIVTRKDRELKIELEKEKKAWSERKIEEIPSLFGNHDFKGELTSKIHQYFFYINRFVYEKYNYVQNFIYFS